MDQSGSSRVARTAACETPRSGPARGFGRRRPALPRARPGTCAAPAGAGADPARARGRREPDDADLLHQPEHRQRLLADGGDLGARARPVARDRPPAGSTCPSARRSRSRRWCWRDRLHPRAVGRARDRRDPRRGRRGRRSERRDLRLRAHPAPVHRHPGDAEHRARDRSVGGARDADPRHASCRAGARRRLDRLAAVFLLHRARACPARRRADVGARVGAVALRRRRQPGRRPPNGHSRQGRCWCPSTS